MQCDPALKELLLRRTGRTWVEGDYGEPGAEVVPVVARLAQAHGDVPGLQIVARFGDVVTGRAALRDLLPLRRDPRVLSLKASRPVGPDLSVSVAEVGGERVHRGDLDGVGLRGAGTAVAVIDWGCDFAHANFRRADGTTRLLCLWDQRGGVGRQSPHAFGYGRLLGRAQIDAALAEADPYAALDYDPSDGDQTGSGSHGTHVLDIAAGNGRAGGAAPGMAPESDLIFVHLAGEGGALGESSRLLEAIRFAFDAAGDMPVVVNCSLGQHGGPHDGCTLVELGIDAVLAERVGRAVCFSTGNYFDANVHCAGLVANGTSVELRWEVRPRNDESAELEIWYPGADRLGVDLVGPDGDRLARVGLGEDAVWRDGGRVVATAYHRARDPNNGDNECHLFLWPDAPVGEFRVLLHGERVVQGGFHAWIERDDPRSQSRFKHEQATHTTTTGTLCNARSVIAVGAYDARSPRRLILPFSSCGPTRDGREKPELIAPGGSIRAARSSRAEDGGRMRDGLTVKSGTSMACPHVTGTVALMFEAAAPRKLRVEETRSILRATSRRHPPFDPVRGGAGRLDAAAAVLAARALSRLGGRAPLLAPREVLRTRSRAPVPEVRMSERDEVLSWLRDARRARGDALNELFEQPAEALAVGVPLRGGQRDDPGVSLQLPLGPGGPALGVPFGPFTMGVPLAGGAPSIGVPITSGRSGVPISLAVPIGATPASQPRPPEPAAGAAPEPSPAQEPTPEPAVIEPPEAVGSAEIAELGLREDRSALEVRVHDAANRGVAGVLVQLLRPSGDIAAAAATSADGLASFSAVDPGVWTVRLASAPPGFTAAPVSVQVAAGSSVPVSLAVLPVAAPAAIPVPTVIVAGVPVVVVAKRGSGPARKAIHLATTAPPSGPGTLTWSRGLRLFDLASGGRELRGASGSPLTAAQLSGTGTTVYAQCDAPSARAGDLSVSLSLGNATPATATLTAVELTLDICKSRSRPGVAPDPLPLAEKLGTGRFLQLQDAAGRAGRARLLVRRPSPASFKGDMVLTVPGSLRIFAAESGGIALGASVRLPAARFASGPVELWAEGAAASANLSDATLWLGLDGEAHGDSVKLSVVEIASLSATIDPTPPIHPRTGMAAGISTPPARHSRTVTTLARDALGNPPWVLLRNSQPDLTLAVVAHPSGVPLRWEVSRGADNASIGGTRELPALRAGRTALEHHIGTDQRGSFQVRAFVDCNGSGGYDEGEPALTLNLVLVEAHAVTGGDTSAFHEGNCHAIIATPLSAVQLGTFSPGSAAMEMDLLVDVIGGGPDGRLGLDQIEAGLINDLLSLDVVGEYKDGGGGAHPVRLVTVSNGADTNGNLPGLPAGLPGTRMMAPVVAPGTTPHPHSLAFPVLDSGKPAAGTGGDTATMSNSGFSDTGPRPGVPAIGRRLRITCLDAPTLPFLRNHPVLAATALQRMRFHLHFSADFCLWSRDADRAYVVVHKVEWGADTNAQVAGVADGLYPLPAGFASTAPRPLRAAARAQDQNVEVRPPSDLNPAVLIWDATA